MRVPITKEMSLEELKTKIEANLPEYQCHFRNKKMLVVKSSSTAAVIVVAGKQKVMVNEGFPSMGGQFLFIICLIGLGVLIPGIIYFAAFFPKQKAIRVKVAELIKKEYGENPDVLDK